MTYDVRESVRDTFVELQYIFCLIYTQERYAYVSSNKGTSNPVHLRVLGCASVCDSSLYGHTY